MKKILISGLIMALFFPVLTINAATIQVPDDYHSIQQAIDASVNGDMIVVDDGIYHPPQMAGFDFSGKKITLKSKSGPANCIIDAQGYGRAFYFHTSEDSKSILQGFTIKNGNIPNNKGGGIFCIYSSPKIYNCTITENYAKDGGGGLYIESASPIIEECTISSNSTHFKGGGIYIEKNSQPEIITCQIFGNEVVAEEGAGGGGICSEESATSIRNCHIYRNTSGYVAGGILIKDSNLDEIINCQIRSNHASSSAGGVLIMQASPVIDGSVIEKNTSEYAAGIYYYNDQYIDIPPVLSDCAITENDATKSGGGLMCVFASPKVTNCNISENSATSWAGGIVLYDRSEPVFDECEIMNNSSDPITGWGGGMGCFDSQPSFTNCIIKGNNGERGGVMYGSWTYQGHINFTNCIIADNHASGNGSAFWLQYSTINFSNCTITDNSSRSAAPEAGTFYLASWGSVSFTDSIIWNSPQHYEISLFSNSILTISYSDIQNGKASVYASDDSTIDWRDGVIKVNPRFISDPDGGGDYYLHEDSGCVNTGSDTSDRICFSSSEGIKCMNELTTRVDDEKDTGMVDLGYHYESSWESLSREIVPGYERVKGEKILYQVKNDILGSGQIGKNITRIVYQHAKELAILSIQYPALRKQIKTCLDDMLQTTIYDLVTPHSDQNKIWLQSTDIKRLYGITFLVKEEASPQFKKDIEYMEKVLIQVKEKTIKEVKAIMSNKEVAKYSLQ